MVSKYGAATFASRFGPWAVVAGASDGIGECFARELAGRGLNVVLLARREKVLRAVADSIRSEHGVEVRIVQADLTDDDILQRVDDGVAPV